MRGAHVEHGAHGCDAGRVEAERLVERVRALPSRKQDVRCGARCGPGAGRAWAGGSARAACTARGPGCEGWGGLGHVRGAHVEHGVHGCDAGRVEAQRLVERRRALPSQKEGVRCRARCGPGAGRAWAGGSARAACTARGPGCEGWGGLGHVRGAHVEHLLHGCDAGRVEAQRLVERRRVLPSRKEGVRCRARCGPGAGRRGSAAAHERQARQEGPAVKAGRARACAERTANMENMLVTLEVSKLSGWLNVYADCRVESKTCDAGRGVGRGRDGV
eukprot:scaffold94312_cov54-Phaeocystis_antarctica.AAC.2